MTNFKQLVYKAIDLNLGFEALFVLYCLNCKDKQLLLDYTSKCKKINTDIFLELKDKGYISIFNLPDNKVYYELLSLTETGVEIIQNYLNSNESNNLISEDNFEDFRKYYPSIVKSGNKTRRLHLDLKRSKISYDKLLMETTHDLLCKCAKLYHNEMIKSNSEYYMQALPTWLSQGNYRAYLEEAKKIQKNTQEITVKQSTNIDRI